MTFAAYTNAQGLHVQYIDGGVVYTYNEHKLEFVGEQESGEVWADDRHGEYERDEEQGTVNLLWDDGAEDIFVDVSEEAYEKYALEMLCKL